MIEEVSVQSDKREQFINLDKRINDFIKKSGVQEGILTLFVPHTTAAVTINENADPDVLVDLDGVLDSLAREDFPYRHTCEGRDDMPAHVKSSLFGSSLLIPVGGGQLRLGIWQGICLCEHRLRATPRRLVLTLQGEWD